MYSQAAQRLHMHEPAAKLRREPADAPLPWAVWLDDDIIGAGRTPGAAVDEAVAQIKAWGTHKPLPNDDTYIPPVLRPRPA
jgi:hypothetical protein